MIPHRVTGPGPRTVALRSAATGIRRLVLSAAVGVFVVACGATGPAGSASPTQATGAPALVAAAPSVDAGPAASGPVPGSSVAPGSSAAPLPSVDPNVQPKWPGATVLAVVHLGIADTQIQKAGEDLQTATNNEDLKAMWGAADGLAKLIDGLMPEVSRLDLAPDTQPIGKLYQKAFPELSAGAKQLRDSITSGDAQGVVAGSQAIAAAINDYAPIRSSIGDLFEAALLQQRLISR